VPFPQKYRPLDGDANNETLCNRYSQKVKEAIDNFKAREVPFAGMMGKPMGNGRPISAVVSSRENVAAFRQQTRYFNTFASSPLQAAAGMAVLNEIEGRGLREASAATGRVY
jgi:adenosylmethionine-8-amino-7-oxononanoate aminotransferase